MTYKAWMLQKGLEESSELVVIPDFADESNPGCTYWLGGAHRMEAFYLAWEQEPQNPFVQQIIREGFPPATILDPRTTPDVAMHFAECGNKFNKKGANMSHLEMYKLVDSMTACIDESEKAYRKEQKASTKITEGKDQKKRSQAGDQTRQLGVILNKFPDTVTKWQVFDHIRIVKRAWSKDDFFNCYDTYCSQNMDFVGQNLDSTTLFHINHWLNLHFGNKEEYRGVLLEMLKFTLPTEDGVPWLIRTVRDCDKLLPLLKELSDTKVFRLSQKITTDKGVAQLGERTKRKDVDSPTTAKNPKKAKQRAKVQGQDKNRVVVAEEVLSVMAESVDLICP